MEEAFAVAIALFILLASHAQKQPPMLVTIARVVQDATSHDTLIDATARLAGLDKSLGSYPIFADDTGHRRFLMSCGGPTKYPFNISNIIPTITIKFSY